MPNSSYAVSRSSPEWKLWKTPLLIVFLGAESAPSYFGLPECSSNIAARSRRSKRRTPPGLRFRLNLRAKPVATQQCETDGAAIQPLQEGHSLLEAAEHTGYASLCCSTILPMVYNNSGYHNLTDASTPAPSASTSPHAFNDVLASAGRASPFGQWRILGSRCNRGDRLHLVERRPRLSPAAAKHHQEDGDHDHRDDHEDEKG